MKMQRHAGLTRLVVVDNPATVHAWEACHPSDCDWGAVPASAFRQSVNGGSQAALQAHFTTGFNETTLIITPVGEGLRVETLSAFHRQERPCRLFGERSVPPHWLLEF